MATVRADLERPEKVVIVDPVELMAGLVPPEVDPQSGCPRQIKAVVVTKDPKMTVLPNFFSDAECDHLVSLVEGYWMPSLVGQATKSTEDEYSKGNLENQLAETRTSWSCMCRYAQTDIVERLEHRLARVAGLGVEHIERMNMVRYAPGEYFDEHHDGKFRPRTVFVYLNDLPEDDWEGDTFFPYLGLSFKPRRGTAVMWSNVVDGEDGEDSRMLHCGRAPHKGVKYGVNCFFNVKPLRQMMELPEPAPFPQTPVISLADLLDPDSMPPGEDCKGADRDPSKLTLFNLGTTPPVCAIAAFLTCEEAEHLADLAGPARSEVVAPSGPFSGGTRVLRVLGAAETPTVEAIETRISGTVGINIKFLARLRVVRPGTVQGLCNRGCGPKSCYICLSERDEVFFYSLGVRIVLSRGDCIYWQNNEWVDEGATLPTEDLRTMRMHLRDQDGNQPALGIDAFFHDFPVRIQQTLRAFVSDEEVAAKQKPDSKDRPASPGRENAGGKGVGGKRGYGGGAAAQPSTG